jgi:hypothetical protein
MVLTKDNVYVNLQGVHPERAEELLQWGLRWGELNPREKDDARQILSQIDAEVQLIIERYGFDPRLRSNFFGGKWALGFHAYLALLRIAGQTEQALFWKAVSRIYPDGKIEVPTELLSSVMRESRKPIERHRLAEYALRMARRPRGGWVAHCLANKTLENL